MANSITPQENISALEPLKGTLFQISGAQYLYIFTKFMFTHLVHFLLYLEGFLHYLSLKLQQRQNVQILEQIPNPKINFLGLNLIYKYAINGNTQELQLANESKSCKVIL